MPRSVTILIVDDDLAFVAWAALALQRAGYPVLPATTIASAKRLLDGFRPHLGLLIINMAVRGAAGLAANLRQAHPALRVMKIGGEDQRTKTTADGFIVYPPDFHDPHGASVLLRGVKALT